MSTVKANTYLAASGSTTEEPSIPALDQRMAKAWVNFNSNASSSIRDSYNVSSITDEAAGKQTINISEGDASTGAYMLSAAWRDANDDANISMISLRKYTGAAVTATALPIMTKLASDSYASGLRDMHIVTVAVFSN